MQCVELKTGKIKWSEDGFGPGNVILTGDNLLALADNGELALIEAQSDGYRELGRRKIVSGKYWSTPIFSKGLVLARSTEEAACLRVR